MPALLLLTTVLWLSAGSMALAAWVDSPLLHNSSRFACSKPGFYTQTACTDAGGAWNADRKWTGGWGTDTGTYGPIVCASCHEKNATNIKRVKQTLAADPAAVDDFPIEADASRRPISFLDAREGTADFGDDGSRTYGDARSDKICEACHSQTSYHNYDISNNTGGNGHFNNSDCISCHTHNQGFRPAVCDSCHNASSALADSHGVHYNSATVAAGITTTNNSTIGNYLFQCGNCHNNVNHAGGAVSAVQAAQVSLFDGGTYAAAGTAAGADRGFNYTAGTCNGTYCHSDGTTTTGPFSGGTPQWTISTMTCGSCHAAQPATRVHTSHVDDITYNFRCAECHAVTVTNAADASVAIADKAQHVDKTKDVNWGTLNSDGTAYVNASTNCANIYCHSDGQKGSAPYNAPSQPVKWTDTSVGCSSCHVSGTNGMISNAHEFHNNSDRTKHGLFFDCVSCHGQMDGTHVNKLTNVKFDFNVLFHRVNFDGDSPTFAGNSTTGATGATRSPGSATGNCANLYCHSIGNLANNTGTGALVAAGDPAVGFKSTPWDSTTQFDCADCHGDGSVAYPAYTSGGAGTTTANSHVKHAGSSGILCATCHQATTISNTNDPTVMTLVVPELPADIKHIDRKETVVYNATVAGASATYDAAVGSKSCANVYCHGSATPQWGGAALNCGSCHGASSALANSHGVHYNVATLATAINANNDSTATDYVFQCGSCHNGTSHAGGAVSAVQAAEVSIISGGIYNAATLAAGTDRGFSYTAGSCKTNLCHQDGRNGPANYNSATVALL